MTQTFTQFRRSLRDRLKKGKVVLWIALAMMIVALTPRVWGQDNATITGTVGESTGAVVANATVDLTNNATGQVRETKSNSVGQYRVADVGIGTYTLTAVASGFEKFTETGIIVNVAQTLEENITLSVGSAAQTVTVAADALQVQTETSEMSTLISGQQVQQLSTNGRNIVQLAALGAGVANNLSSFGGINALTSSNGISFNGMRTTHNVYLLDGTELNDRGCGGCYMVLPSQDSIAEFQTLQSNYQPDYGIGSGGTITMVIKSGTRRYHGEVYEYNRNTAYNANDYFNKQAGRSRPEFMLNEPGGNIGGPVFIPHVYDENKTRTFFFWNEEWRRLIQGATPTLYSTIMANNFPTAGQDLNYTPYVANPVIPVVPNLPNNASYTAMETGLGLTPGKPFPLNANGTYKIPRQMLDPNTVTEANSGMFPKPNLANGYQYVAAPAQPNYVREDTVRIDHSINSKMQLMGHYVHDAVNPTFIPPLWAGGYPTVGTTMTNPSYTSAIKLTQTYSPNVLNETAFLYSGNKITLTPIGVGGTNIKLPSGWSASSYFPVADNAGQDMPAITFSGKPFGATATESYYPWRNGYEGFQYRDDLSWTLGRHQLKFGGGVLHDYKNQQLQALTNGTANFSSSNANFSGDAYVDFLLGLANSFTQLQYLSGKHWVNNNYNGYANDNWHLNKRLVLNLGIRFDGIPHAFERYNQFANFVPAFYNTSLGNPVNAATGALNPSSLTTFSCPPTRCATNGEQFYLNGIAEAGVNGFPRGNVANSYHTWQPRLGFAYDIAGDGRTVIRGGAGMFFERVQGNDVYNAALNPPFAYQPSGNNVMFSNPNISALTGINPPTVQLFPSTMTTIKYNYPPPATANYSLSIQRQIAPSMVLAVAYVGSDGWDQNNDRQINVLPLSDLPDRQKVAGGANANPYRNFPGFNNINQEENETNFNYNSLQGTFRIENRHGLTTQLSYTWSHNIDIGQNDLAGLNAPYNAKFDRGSDAGLDRRHIFNASYVYALPFFEHSGNFAAREIAGNWSISGITAMQTGTANNITGTPSGADTVGLGAGSNRPDLVSPVVYLSPKQTINGTTGHWFSKASFATPQTAWSGLSATNGYGTARKDTIKLPGFQHWNLSLFKVIPLTAGEGTKLELRFESFNTFNHTNFNAIDATASDGNFGSVTGDFDSRVLELGGKITF
jgi:Carboxypeptidase regulatory-like domain